MGLFPPEGRLIRAASLALLLAGSLFAEVRIEARLAWGGQARPDTWTAVRLEIWNTGEGAMLSVEIEGGGGRVSQGIDAPGGSRRVHWVCVRAARRMALAVRSGAATLHEAAFEPVLATRGERLIAVAAGTTAGLPSKAGWTSIACGAEDLPDVSDAYDGLDAVVVAFPGPAVPEGAVDAIRRWTRAGGTLAVMAGIDAETAARGGLGVLLPARITGVRELTTLRSIDEGIPTPAAPFPVAVCERLPGAEDVLGAFRAPAGLGRCILVPFDASLRPVSDWGGLERRWSEWLDLRRPSTWGLPYRRMANKEESMRMWWEALRQAEEERDREREGFVSAASSGRRHVLGWFFALLAGFALAAGPLEWFGLRRLGRQPWTWATFPLLVALACAGGWIFGMRSLPRGPEVRVLGVLDVWPEGARETSVLAVTAPENLRCDLRLGARDARLWSCDPGKPEGTGKKVPQTLFSGAPSPSAREIDLKAWRPRLLIVTADLPPSAFRLEMTGSDLRFYAPGPLRGARWLTGGEPVPLGDLSPGEPVPRGPSGAGLPFPSGTFQADAATLLLRLEAGVPEGGRRLVVPTPEHPVLAGWIETSPSSPTIAGRTPARALLYVRIHHPGPR